jgi:hypothetical protein
MLAFKTTGAPDAAAARAAALAKYRAKRSSRGMGVEIRYPRRAALAEARPRVHGRCVRAQPGAEAALAGTSPAPPAAPPATPAAPSATPAADGAVPTEGLAGAATMAA